MSLLGAIIAGGRSERFGSDKAVAIWRGRTLLEHAFDLLEPNVAAVVICGREWPGGTCIADRPHADLGPLGGINAALAYGKERGFDRVLSVPCDVPVVPLRVIERLIASPDAAIVADLPVIGIWPTALARALDRHLATTGSRSVRGWARAVAADEIRLEDGEELRNVNRPSDLAKLDG